MTIGGLWKYFNDKVGVKTIPASDFRGSFIAMDFYGSIYSYRSTAKKQYLRSINPFYDEIDEYAIDTICIDKLFRMLMRYMNNGIVPILVYDGPKKARKADTLNKRQAVEDRSQTRVNYLREEYTDVDPIFIPYAVVDELRNILTVTDKAPYNSIIAIRDFFISLGIPHVMADGEAERTCALMVHDGVCPAAQSSDGDALASHCNVVIREEADYYRQTDRGAFGEAGFRVAVLDDLLKELDLNFEQFQELCIYSGTDFGHVYRISFVSALKNMRKHQAFTFEELEQCGLDLKGLDYVGIREEFALVPWDCTVVEHQLELIDNPSSDYEALEARGLLNHYDDLQRVKSDLFDILTANS